MSTYDYSKILELYDRGLKLQEVADLIGCSTVTVSNVAKQNGRSPVARRYPQRATWDDDAILSDYQAGLPIADILQKHQVSLGSLHRRIKSAGIPLRKRPSLTGSKNGQYKHGLGDRRSERNKELTLQVAAICLGHVVPHGWTIHHIDDNPSNDQPENLAIFPTRSAHSRYHQQQLSLQRAGLEVDATRLVLENGGFPLPIPDHPILLPQDKDRLFPHE